ncbi:MAG TPA: DinB family protein [Longimicrobiaceae bacterium]|nr:DinB family protein [Longimicrobiaceae bacterium]
MTETARIVDQLRRAHDGPAWHGPSLREALDGVTAEQAAARPVPGAHTIREIVLHLAAWEDALRRRLEGERTDEPAEGDWPAAAGEGEAGWAELLGTLGERQRRLRDAAARLDDAQLDAAPYEGTFTRYVTLHGEVQHTLYHAGQIVLLRKALNG